MLVNRGMGGGINAGQSFFLPLGDAGSGAVNTTPVSAFGDGTPTFTRADNTATTVNSAGLIIPVNANIARSYYDPTTLTYRGYLPEGARTNICIRTTLEGGGAAPTGWTQFFGTGTSAPAASIYGNADAAVAYLQTATAERPFLQSTAFSVSSASVYSLSIFVETITGTVQAQQVLTSIGYPGDATVSFPVCPANPAGGNTGTVTTGRMTILLTTTATAGTATLRAGLGVSSNTTGTIQFSRPQAELGSSASSYIPTTTATVTRNADVLTYAFAGNASATAGACYAELSTQWSTAEIASIAVGFISAAAGTLYREATGTDTAITMFDGTTGLTKSGITAMSTGSRKRVAAWGGSTMSTTGDGAAVATGAFDGNMGSTALAIGCDTGGIRNWFGTIRNVRIWTRQLTDAQLQGLTS